MPTPNSSELLVQEAHRAEQLKLLLMAMQCETLEEYIAKLQALIRQ